MDRQTEGRFLSHKIPQARTSRLGFLHDLYTLLSTSIASSTVSLFCIPDCRHVNMPAPRPVSFDRFPLDATTPHYQDVRTDDIILTGFSCVDLTYLSPHRTIGL